MADPVMDYETQFGLTPNHVSAVGSYIITWNFVELQFEIYAAAATGFRQQHIEVLMGSTSVPSNMKSFIALIEGTLKDPRFSELRTDGIACGKELMGLSNFRNEVAHGRWIMDLSHRQQYRKQDGSIITAGTLKSSKTLSGGPTVTLEKLQSEIVKLQKLQFRVQDLLWRHQAILNPATIQLPSPWHGKF
jgi:hypothetical protein